MKLINDYDWNRRDFRFDAECEGCGNVESEISGYDDSNFYNNVIPDMKCKKCGKSSNELGVKYEPEQPYYNENQII